MERKALALVGKNRFVVKELKPISAFSEENVVLDIIACGICGTDLSFIDTCAEKLDQSLILGHEFVGKVVSLGKRVTNLKKGDVVVANPGVNCQDCLCCLKGQPNLCPDAKFVGYPPLEGGFQQQITIPVRLCLPIPKNITPLYASLTEPLAVALHAINLAKISYGTNAAVIGCGPIGLMIIKLLRKFGVRQITAYEPNKFRRDTALLVGADIAIDPRENDLIERIDKESTALASDVVFEVCGKALGISLCSKITLPGGKIILGGIPMDDKISMSHMEARKKGLTIFMVRGLLHTMLPALEELSNDESYNIFLNDCLAPEKMNQFISDYHTDSHKLLKGIVVF